MSELTGVSETSRATSTLPEIADGRAEPRLAVSQSVVVGSLAILVAAVVVSFQSTVQSLIAAWEDTDATTYTHGYAVVLICGWLLWRDRADIARRVSSPSLFAAALLAACSVGWLVLSRAGIQVAHQLLLPLLMGLAIWTAFGLRAARVCAFALGYLVFATQIWGSINGVLQAVTVSAVDVLLRITGVPAVVDGNLVHIVAGDFEIAGGCSGLHFFIVALALAALYGEINRDSLKIRIVLMALAAAMAMVANWVRVYAIILAGYFTDMQHYLVQVEHVSFGWGVFSVMCIGYFLIARRLPAEERGEAPVGSVQMRAASGVVASTALALVALLVGPAWGAVSPLGAAERSPKLIASGTGASARPMNSWQPRFVGADHVERASYGDAAEVEVFLAWYASQRQGKELIGYDNSIVDSADQIVATTTRRNALKDPVGEIQVRRGSQDSLIWYRYEAGAYRGVNTLAAQIGYALASLHGRPGACVVAARMTCASNNCDSTREHLAGVMKLMSESEEQRCGG